LCTVISLPLAAAQDINNIGGTIDARNTLVASAGRDINSASTSESEVRMVLLEDAYSQIANGILWFVQEDEWSCAKASVSIWHSSTQVSYTRIAGEKKITDDRFPPLNIALDSSDAFLFLRDRLLEMTGQRIWGMEFTLFTDGTFEIEYDYSVPIGYEETDESISGIEINQSLQELRADSDKK